MIKRSLCKIFTIMLAGISLSAFSTEAKLSDYHPKKDNATAAFKAAIKSGASKIIIDNPGFPIQLDTITLRSQLELQFEDGVIVEARKNAFKSLGAFLFSAVNCSDIKMHGKGKVILRMRKSDYQNKKLYNHSEWRHLLGIKGCNNILVKNLTIESSGGDGIYLGTTSKNPCCKNVIIEDLNINDHHRQGISIISAENLTIRRCKITNTSGTPPAAGIDFEPNSKPKGQRLVNCLVEDCTISGNKGGGIIFYTVYMEGERPPQSITVRNCLIKQNGTTGIMITNSFHRKGRNKVAAPTGFYKFENCKLIDNAGSSLIINDSLPTVKLTFDNCLIKPGNTPDSFPVLLAAQHMKEAAIGGIEFKDLLIEGLKNNSEVIGFKSWHQSSVTNISGDIYFKTKNAKKRFHLKKRIKEIQERVKQKSLSKFKQSIPGWTKFQRSKDSTTDQNKQLPGLRTRDRFNYIVWAKSGEKVNIKIKMENPAAIRKVKFSLRSFDGEKIYSSELNRKHRSDDINFVAKNTGCYLLSGASGGESMIISSNIPGSWYSDNRPLLIAGKHNRLFFAVPAGAKDFQLEVAGYLGQPFIKAMVKNPQGKIIASNKTIQQPYIFNISRENSSSREIWSLDIELSDNNKRALIRQGQPLEGVFAASPGQLLERKK